MTRKKLSFNERLEEVIAGEKRGAAIHECSHAALVRLYGGLAAPDIWRSEAADLKMKAWVGTCTIYALPGELKLAHVSPWQFKTIRTPRKWNVYVGAAGYIGELIANGWEDDADIANEFVDAIASGEISDTDRRLIGKDDITWREVRVVTTHLRQCWDGVMREAANLVDTRR